MARYRNALPQLGADLFLTDGGIETTLIFHEGLELPYFAAFHLFRHGRGYGVCHYHETTWKRPSALLEPLSKRTCPVAISFTVEIDGKLPTGQTLKAAIEQMKGATSGYPCYYMINCAHRTHFEPVLTAGEPGWNESGVCEPHA